MFRLYLLFGIVGLFGLPTTSHAAPTPPLLTFRYRHFVFPIQQNQISRWRGDEELWTYQGHPIDPPSELRVDGDDVPPLPPGFERTLRQGWVRSSIEQTLREVVLPEIERDAGSVRIHKSETGSIVFDGVGFPGQHVRMEEAIDLTITALNELATDVTLPVEEIAPEVQVDASLEKQGIRELVTIGESNFRGSPINRRHNIGVGLKRFNGHLIPKDTVFSFNEVLGPVNEHTGYRKELTIKGDKTLPDYGGGLCQISTTAYRGVWEYGFPIKQRRNHSYTVRYYAPAGTDATIYPPDTDVKFLNDSPGSLLMQTFQRNDHAYFLYYGTRDERTTELLGPYTWGSEPPPPSKTEYTTEIAPGEIRKVGEAVPGMKAMWYRIVRTGENETIEPFYSGYEARPLFHQIGIAPGELPPETASSASSTSSSSSRSVRATVRSRFPVMPQKPRRNR